MIQAASVQRVFASGAFLCGLWGGHWQAPAAPRFQHSDSGSIFRGHFQTLAGTFQTFSVSICLTAFPSIHILLLGIGEYWSPWYIDIYIFTAVSDISLVRQGWPMYKHTPQKQMIKSGNIWNLENGKYIKHHQPCAKQTLSTFDSWEWVEREFLPWQAGQGRCRRGEDNLATSLSLKMRPSMIDW